jgi:predicted ribosome quality control (RQC) complex YloA/Tae2 family protein
VADVALLRIGRHFRFGKNKMIVGRNELENNLLASMRAQNDYILEAQNIESPLTLLQGRKSVKAIRIAAELTVFYSDAKNGEVEVGFGREKLDRLIIVSIPSQTEVEKFRIGN